MKIVSINIDVEGTGPIISLLNLALRDTRLSIKCAEAYNNLFKQLPLDDDKVCGDHESMEWRRNKINSPI